MSQKANARRAVIGSCIALFANMGMNSTFTVFLMTLIAKWPEAAPVMLLPITVGCAMSFVCSSFLMGPLMKKLSPRAIFLACAVLGALYCGCYAFAGSYTVLIAASVFGGLVLSLGTHAMGVNAITPYFGEFGAKTGITIGAVLASASVGAAVFSFAPGLIDITGSLRNAYLTIGAVVVLCNVAAYFIIPKAPKADASAAAAAGTAAQEQPGLTMSRALKTPSFWLVFFGIFFMTVMYQGLCGHLPTFLKIVGMEENRANSMQGVMQFVGIFFVLFGGAIVNKIGVKGLILLAGVPLAAGCLLFGYAFHDPTAVWFAVICSILCVSGAMILNICPVITPALFGAKEMNRINAVYSGGVFWGAAAVAAQILNFVISENVNGEVVPAHYDRGFLLAVVFGVAGMVCLFASLALNPMKKAEKA